MIYLKYYWPIFKTEFEVEIESCLINSNFTNGVSIKIGWSAVKTLTKLFIELLISEPILHLNICSINIIITFIIFNN